MPRTTVRGWPRDSDTGTVPRTAWGQPDLQGIWDFRTITPLQRPSNLADKEFLTAEEAAEFEQQQAEQRNADRRDGGAQRDVAQAYNDFWLVGGRVEERVASETATTDSR